MVQTVLEINNSTSWRNEFVGREHELKFLKDNFKELIESENQNINLINIIGESGLGKTRLVQAFYNWLSQNYDKRDPYGYWPDHLSIEHKNLRLNPDMDKYALIRQGTPVMPYLWWGLRTEDVKYKRNLSESLGQSFISGYKTLERHLGLVRESDRLKASQKALSEGAVKTLISLSGFGFLGDTVSSLVGNATGSKDFIDGVKSGFSGIRANRKRSKRLEKLKGSVSEQIDYYQFDHNPPSDYLSEHYLEDQDLPESINTSSTVELRDKLINNLIELTTLHKEFLDKSLPLVVVIDDAQWLDEKSLSFLTELVTQVKKHDIKLFLINTHWEKEWRENESANKGVTQLKAIIEQTDKCQQLWLAPIDDLSPLVSHALSGGTASQHQMLLEKAGGNPLLMTELLHYARTPRFFVNRDFNEPLTQAAESRLSQKEFELHEIIAERFDSLEEINQQLVSFTAFLGEKAPKQLLQVLTTLVGEFDLNERLNRIEEFHCLITCNQEGVIEFPQKIYQSIALQIWNDFGHDQHHVKKLIKHCISKFVEDSSIPVNEFEEELILIKGLELFSVDLIADHTVRVSLIIQLHELLIDSSRFYDACKMILREFSFLTKMVAQSTNENHVFSCIHMASSLFRMGHKPEAENLISTVDTYHLKNKGLLSLVVRKKTQFAIANGNLTKAKQIIEQSKSSLGNESFEIESLISFARISKNEGRIEEAIELYQRIVDIIGFHTQRPQSLLQLSQVLCSLGHLKRYKDFEIAEECFTKSLQINERLYHIEGYNDPARHGEIQILGRYSDLYALQENYDRTLELLQKATVLIEPLKEQATEDLSTLKTCLSTLGKLAACHQKIKQYEEAEEHLAQSFYLINNFSGKIDQITVQIILKLEKTMFFNLKLLHKYQGCVEFGEQLVQRNPQPNDKLKLDMVEIFFDLAKCHEKLADEKKQRKWLKKCWQLIDSTAEEKMNPWSYSVAAYVLALLYRATNKEGDVNAIRYLELSADYERKTAEFYHDDLKKQVGLAITLSRLAQQKIELGDWQDGFKNASEALSLLNKKEILNNNSFKLEQITIGIYQNFREVDAKKGNIESAIIWQQKIIKLLEIENDQGWCKKYQEQKAKALFYNGELHFRTGDNFETLNAFIEYVNFFEPAKKSMRLKRLEFWCSRIVKRSKTTDVFEPLDRLIKLAQTKVDFPSIDYFKAQQSASDQPELTEEEITHANTLIQWIEKYATKHPFNYSVTALANHRPAKEAFEALAVNLFDELGKQIELIKFFTTNSLKITPLSSAEWGRMLLIFWEARWYAGHSKIHRTLVGNSAKYPMWGKNRIGLLANWIVKSKSMAGHKEMIPKIIREVKQAKLYFKFPSHYSYQLNQNGLYKSLYSLCEVISDELCKAETSDQEFPKLLNSFASYSENIRDLKTSKLFQALSNSVSLNKGKADKEKKPQPQPISNKLELTMEELGNQINTIILTNLPAEPDNELILATLELIDSTISQVTVKDLAQEPRNEISLTVSQVIEKIKINSFFSTTLRRFKRLSNRVNDRLKRERKQGNNQLSETLYEIKEAYRKKILDYKKLYEIDT